MFKGLGDMGKLMKQAQEMQAKMAEATEKMSEIVGEATSGAGMAKATASGQGEGHSIDVAASLLASAADTRVTE